MTYIHIKQALKLILPREYIARCRQKRHWAAKYLPGKAPLDPSHDVMKFSHVALKSLLKGKKVCDIACVEAIQSSKDGSHVTSFKLRGDSNTKARFSMYQRSSIEETYHIHIGLGLTHWRVSSSILGAVELIPVMEDTPGCYRLHETSKKRMDEMGYICRGDVKHDADAATPETTVEEQSTTPLPDDFYEIDDLLERRLCKDTLTYEYKVRFKGYSSDDDMWLPGSYFNRAIKFESLSKFGRKRKHKIDPDAAREPSNKKTKTCEGKQDARKTRCEEDKQRDQQEKRSENCKEKQSKKQRKSFPFHPTPKP